MPIIALCDDEPRQMQQLVQAVATLKEQWGEPFRVQTFACGTDLLDAAAKTPFSVAVMDILLKDENGIDVAAQLYERSPYVQIIFVSVCPDFMYESYRVPHVWYVKRDDVPSVLPQALQRALTAAQSASSSQLQVHSRGRTTVVPCCDVLYLEQNGRTSIVHTRGGSLREYKKITEYLPQTAYNDFLQCHKSYIVNAQHIIRYAYNALTLTDGSTVPVSRTFLPSVRAALTQSSSPIFV